jgi:hypothetical protein
MDDNDQGPSSVNGFSKEEGSPSDGVDALVGRVRQDLADRRAAGVIPHLPESELDRQFSAVIDAVDAGLVEDPPLDTGPLAGLSVLETWQPRRGGLRTRLIRPIVHIPSRLVGALVRRQVQGFSRKAFEVIEHLVTRQNKMVTFLTRVHLDRLRGLEYRVAELEREVTMLRGESSTEQLASGARHHPGGDDR